jgi:hypothetical protein
MRIRLLRFVISALASAALFSGCAGGGSSVSQSAGTVPSAAQRGIVPNGQAEGGRQAHSGQRRTLSEPTCSASTLGVGAFIGGDGGNGGEGDNPNVANGQFAFVGAGSGNNACDSWSAIAGGYNNAVSGSSEDGFIGAGEGNVVTGSDIDSLVVGGSGNQVSNADSAIVGGQSNKVSIDNGFVGGGSTNMMSGEYGAIVGGQNNDVSIDNGFLGGGSSNIVSGEYGAIAGGLHNTVSGQYGVLSGGNTNTVSGSAAVIAGGQGSLAEGAYATVPGGYDNNAAGELSFAAGFKSYARYAGSFVWSDYASGATLLESTGVNQFLARATGGFTLWTNAANTVGAKLAPGSGTWASASDRNLKTDVARIDDAAVLDKVAALPIERWSYKSERGVRHVGPMAQDFYAAFGVGEDDKHITSIDEDGVALAAIKALHAENAHLRARLTAENATLRSRLAADEAHVRRVDAELDRIVAALGNQPK